MIPQDEGEISATTPPAIDCPNSLCDGKYDGNYEIPSKPNYFVQCVSGLAYCQACWPISLVFSQECNQCLYAKSDECVTTENWTPSPTHYCPDMCPSKGHDFSGNMYDDSNPKHYVACWHGTTVGCVDCPGDLMFNEEYNACLYEGLYHTKPQ